MRFSLSSCSFSVALLLPVLALTACSAGRERVDQPRVEEPALRDTRSPYEDFPEVVSAITQGEIEFLTRLSRSPNDEETAVFLRQLYARYGPVEKVYVLAYFQEREVARAVFVAAHRNGPFLWDVARSPAGVTMLRGSADIGPWLSPIENGSLDQAREVAAGYIDALNAGNPMAVYEKLICNCMTAAAFNDQAEALVRQAKGEEARRHLRTDTLPGMQEVLRIEHFVSERSQTWLGFHLTLWKTDAGWMLNSINWTEREVAPLPAAGSNVIR